MIIKREVEALTAVALLVAVAGGPVSEESDGVVKTVRALRF